MSKHQNSKTHAKYKGKTRSVIALHEGSRQDSQF